jgi:hypothetical protein
MRQRQLLLALTASNTRTKRALIETEREEERHMITKPKQIFAKQNELLSSIENYSTHVFAIQT